MKDKERNYDKIFITNLPNFYKKNLFNKISSSEKILVIFTGLSPEQRNKDFFSGEFHFDHISFDHSKSVLYRTRKLATLFSKYRFSELVLGGWDESVQWIAAFLSKKSKNSMIVESSEYESSTNGIKGFFKKVFLSRISKVYASGKSQAKLVTDLGFNNKIIITGGVGLYNRRPNPKFSNRDKIQNLLYVGRLSPEKNLIFLLKKMQDYPELILHIVGYGPQEQELHELAGKNVIFHGAVNNTDLFEFYSKFDIFVLPSTREPWGMVVEEALNAGMPVLVSNRVGCHPQIVQEGLNGFVFDLSEDTSFDKCLQKMLDISVYNSMRKFITTIPFEEIENKQVKAYLKSYENNPAN